MWSLQCSYHSDCLQSSFLQSFLTKPEFLHQLDYLPHKKDFLSHPSSKTRFLFLFQPLLWTHLLTGEKKRTHYSVFVFFTCLYVLNDNLHGVSWLVSLAERREKVMSTINLLNIIDLWTTLLTGTLRSTNNFQRLNLESWFTDSPKQVSITIGSIQTTYVRY